MDCHFEHLLLDGPAVASIRGCGGPHNEQMRKIGDDTWGGKKGVPKNQSSIDMLKKLAVDCPAIAGSMERLASDIQAYLQKQAEAREHLQQLPIYDPGGLNPMAGAMGPY
jgi:hypothetical protein